MYSFDSASTEISPLQNPGVSLDYSLLSSFVTSLLYCDTKECPKLPTFRIKELLAICGYKSVSTQKLKKNYNQTYPNEFRLSYVALAYFTLCYYFSLNTVYPMEVMREVIFLIQTILIESSVYENHLGLGKKLEMDSLISCLQKQPDIDIDHSLEIFQEGLEIVKAILRESFTVARAMNKAKDLTKLEEKRQAIPRIVDSYNSFCLYTSSAFALFHIGMNVQKKKNLSLIIGFAETLIVCMLTKPSSSFLSNSQQPRGADSSGNTDKNSKPGSGQQQTNSSSQGKDGTTQKEKEKDFPYSMSHCVNYIQRLSRFVAHVVFEERYLEELRIAKHRLAKHFAHPSIAFMKFRTGTFRTVYGVNDGNSNSSAGPASTSSITMGQKLLPQKEGFYFFDHILLDISLIDPNEDDNYSSSITMMKQELQKEFSGNRRDSLTSIWTEQSVNSKKNDHFWRLKKSFRFLFLIFDTIPMQLCFGEEHFQQAFSADENFQPSPISVPKGGELCRIKGTQAMSLTAAARYLESYLYWNCRVDLLPRTVNPFEEIYWICSYSIEYLLKQATMGEGFRPSLLQEMEFLKRKLKEHHHTPGASTEGAMKDPFNGTSLPMIVSSSSAHNLMRKNDISSEHRVKESKSKGRGIDLDMVLRQAKKEAEIESRLLKIEQQMRNPYSKAPSNTKPVASAPQSTAPKVGGSLLDSLVAQQQEKALKKKGAEEEEDDEEIDGDDDVSAIADIEDGEISPKALNSSLKPAIRSVVWYCSPKILLLTTENQTLPLNGNEKSSSLTNNNNNNNNTDEEDDEDYNPLKSLPSKQQSIEYSKQIQQFKQRQENQLQAFQQYLTDIQESIIQKNKLTKQYQLNKMKEKFKEDLHAQELFQQEFFHHKEKESIQMKLQLDKEQQRANQAKEKERMRIYELKAIKAFQQEQQQLELQRQIEFQQYQIKNLFNKQEQEEIIRREMEEQRMRYLEKRQQEKERRILEKQEQLKKEESIKHQNLLKDIHLSQARVRRGNFQWVNGKYQYYDNVRKEDHPSVVAAAAAAASKEQQSTTDKKKKKVKETVESAIQPFPQHSRLMYLQYEDEYGQPFYYDPILQLYSRRKPEDAEIVHHIQYEREQYDAVHGVGAYDAYQEEIAWKKEVNRNGGWYDETGKWVVARGYYDENNNYEWVDLDGYYDEYGNYIKYPKISGDLSFMV